MTGVVVMVAAAAAATTTGADRTTTIRSFEHICGFRSTSASEAICACLNFEHKIHSGLNTGNTLKMSHRQ